MAIEIDLGTNPGVVVFTSLEDAAAWIKTEQDFWKWLPTDKDRGQFGYAMHKQVTQLQADFEGILARGKSDGEKLIDVEARLVKSYRNPRKALHSSTPEANFVAQIWKSTEAPFGALIAGAAAWHLVDPDVVPARSHDFVGVIRAELFRIGVRGSGESEKAALETLRRDASKSIASANLELDCFSDLCAELVKASNEELEERKKQWAAAATEAERTLQGQVSDNIKRLDEVEERFRKRLELEAPVSYWTDKENEHADWASTYAIFASICGAIGATAAAGFALWAATRENPNYFTFVPAAIIGVSVVWLTRILVRLYLSNVHLAADAAQRVVMTKTYLALLENPKAAASVEDRHLVLQELFRHVPTGVVKDDASPAHPYEILAKVLNVGDGK